ncbi:MAG: hypothetical protein JSW40_04185 [Candidatus Omnitrophota bacterium]|nr:MAG: hypothetical protein JSW40_04185 [Candidatus Omnitrophota bacterium]
MDCRWIKVLLACIFLFLVYTTVYAERILPSSQDLARIEKRGRQIAEYQGVVEDVQSIFFAGAFADRNTIPIAIKKADKWTVYFGTFAKRRNKFEVIEVLIYPDVYSSESTQIDLEKLPKRIRTPREVVQRAGAIRCVLESLSVQEQSFQYNISVFREIDKTITVYLTPKSHNPEVILLGGDWKVSVAPGGSRVLNKTQLHRSTLEMSLRQQKDKELVGGFHTHVLGDLPTETDVALILLHPELGPHFIKGRQWLSIVNKDGKIAVQQDE